MCTWRQFSLQSVPQLTIKEIKKSNMSKYGNDSLLTTNKTETFVVLHI